MEGEEKREDRPYSKEEILAMEQKKDKHPSVLTMSGPIQSGFIQPEIILPSYEEMTADELLNGPGPMETQTDPETIKLEQPQYYGRWNNHYQGTYCGIYPA